MGTLVAQHNTPDPVIKSCVTAERVRYRALAVCPTLCWLVTCRKQKARQLDRVLSPVILLGFLFAFVKVTGLMNSSTSRLRQRRPSLICPRLNNQEVSVNLLHRLYTTSGRSWKELEVTVNNVYLWLSKCCSGNTTST